MAVATSKSVTGTIPFKIPGIEKECVTWYRVFGDLDGGVRPLIGLHGGPGVGHNYLLSLEDLATKYGIPVILYDQIGCGKSTLLPEKTGDHGFWTVDLFLKELDNVIAFFKLSTYSLFGNSWGGMLASEHAILQPAKMHKVIIADSPASMVDWLVGVNRLRKDLPQHIQDILAKHEKDGTTESEEYENAVQVFYEKHVCCLQPWPQDVVDTFDNLKVDATVYHTMNGPSEFFVIGNLKTWSVKGKLGKIKAPTLLLNGRHDEAVDEVVQPFFEEIGKVKWFTFAESSHMPHWEERGRFMEVVSQFLHD